MAAARLAAAELGVRLDERTFLHAALASVAVPNALLPDPDPPPRGLPPEATGPTFDLDDAQDRERYERGCQEGTIAPGTTVRFNMARRAAQRLPPGPKAVRTYPVLINPPGPEPRQ